MHYPAPFRQQAPPQRTVRFTHSHPSIAYSPPPIQRQFQHAQPQPAPIYQNRFVGNYPQQSLLARPQYMPSSGYSTLNNFYQSTQATPSFRQHQQLSLFSSPQRKVKEEKQEENDNKFGTEDVEHLCDVPLEESTVYCVICEKQYSSSEQDEHLKKHSKRNEGKKEFAFMKKSFARFEEYSIQQAEKKYILKPIVEPQEYNITRDPINWKLVDIVNYKSQAEPQTRSTLVNTEDPKLASQFEANLQGIPFQFVQVIPPAEPPAKPSAEPSVGPFGGPSGGPKQLKANSRLPFVINTQRVQKALQQPTQNLQQTVIAPSEQSMMVVQEVPSEGSSGVMIDSNFKKDKKVYQGSVNSEASDIADIVFDNQVLSALGQSIVGKQETYLGDNTSQNVFGRQAESEISQNAVNKSSVSNLAQPPKPGKKKLPKQIQF